MTLVRRTLRPVPPAQHTATRRNPQNHDATRQAPPKENGRTPKDAAVRVRTRECYVFRPSTRVLAAMNFTALRAGMEML